MTGSKSPRPFIVKSSVKAWAIDVADAEIQELLCLGRILPCRPFKGAMKRNRRMSRCICYLNLPSLCLSLSLHPKKCEQCKLDTYCIQLFHLNLFCIPFIQSFHLKGFALWISPRVPVGWGFQLESLNLKFLVWKSSNSWSFTFPPFRYQIWMNASANSVGNPLVTSSVEKWIVFFSIPRSWLLIPCCWAHVWLLRVPLADLLQVFRVVGTRRKVLGTDG